MFRTAVSSGEVWGVAATVATSATTKTNKHFMPTRRTMLVAILTKHSGKRDEPDNCAAQRNGGRASVEIHEGGLQPRAGCQSQWSWQPEDVTGSFRLRIMPGSRATLPESCKGRFADNSPGTRSTNGVQVSMALPNL